VSSVVGSRARDRYRIGGALFEVTQPQVQPNSSSHGMVMWFSHTQPMPRQMGHFLFVMEGVPNEYLRPKCLSEEFLNHMNHM
jgi:hypothetical protein